MNESGEKGSVREMIFYGERVAQLLKLDMKLLTLRKPNMKYDFEIGEVIEANCPDSGEKVRLVVVDNLKKLLKDFSLLELALDGYDGVESAAYDLTKYYPDIDERTVMQGVVTMTEDRFLKLSEEKQKLLLELGFSAAEDVDQPLKEVFLHAWCGWVITRGGGIREWRGFLLNNDLASIYDWEEEYAEYEEAEKLAEIWLDRESPLYRELILVETEE